MRKPRFRDVIHVLCHSELFFPPMIKTHAFVQDILKNIFLLFCQRWISEWLKRLPPWVILPLSTLSHPEVRIQLDSCKESSLPSYSAHSHSLRYKRGNKNERKITGSLMTTLIKGMTKNVAKIKGSKQQWSWFLVVLTDLWKVTWFGGHKIKIRSTLWEAEAGRL